MNADGEPPRDAGDAREAGGSDAARAGHDSDPGKTRVKVRIAGEEHHLRSAVDPEHTRRCAALVDERIREIHERGGLLEGHRAAILAALSIADQYLRTADDLDRTQREVASRTEALVQRIEAGLGEAGSEPAGPPPSAPPEDPPPGDGVEEGDVGEEGDGLEAEGDTVEE